jgi:hypothetical protein
MAISSPSAGPSATPSSLLPSGPSATRLPRHRQGPAPPRIPRRWQDAAPSRLPRRRQASTPPLVPRHRQAPHHPTFSAPTRPSGTTASRTPGLVVSSWPPPRSPESPAWSPAPPSVPDAGVSLTRTAGTSAGFAHVWHPAAASGPRVGRQYAIAINCLQDLPAWCSGLVLPTLPHGRLARSRAAPAPPDYCRSGLWQCELGLPLDTAVALCSIAHP